MASVPTGEPEVIVRYGSKNPIVIAESTIFEDDDAIWWSLSLEDAKKLRADLQRAIVDVERERTP